MHLCGGELQNIAFFAKAESCNHVSKDHHVAKKNKSSCPFHSSTKKNKDGCCDDKELMLEFLDVTSVFGAPMQLSVHHGILFQLPQTSLNKVVLSILFKRPQYLNYKPPLIFKDIPVHIQSFLI